MFKFNLKQLNPFPGFTSQEAIGVDFSGNNLKIAVVRMLPSRKEVANLLNIDISGMSDPEISKAVKDSVGGLGANTDVFDIIPSNLVITKNIEIPSIDQREIREILNLQAGRHTPYSREEIIVDFVEIGTYKRSYTKVLLVIVARNVVKRHYEILERAGFKLRKVFFAPEGLALGISRLLKLETDNSPVNIVHVDESFTDFSIVLKGKVVFIRAIPIGTLQLKGEKEIYQERFVEELKRSLEAYLSEDIEKSPNMLVLTGAEDELRGVESLLNNTMHLPIKFLPYSNSLNISELAKRSISNSKQISFFDVTSCVLNSEEVKINLVPEEVRVRRSIEERGKDLIKTGVFVLTLFVLLFFILVSKIYFKGVQLSKLNNKYSNLAQEAKTLENDYLKIGLVKNYLNSRGFSLEVLTELHNITPEDVELTEIRYEEEKFTVRGTADATSSVFSFVDNMSKSKLFKDVKTKYTSKRKDGQRDLTDFEITALIKRGAE